MTFDKIAVVDFGGQYAHLIATKVRRLHVFAEILAPDAPIGDFSGYHGIILSGSPAMSSDGEGSGFTSSIFDLDTPILGFCFGHQEIAKAYGGAVEQTMREFGPADLHIIDSSPIFAGLDPVERVWMSHGDTVTRLPSGFRELGYSTTGEGDQQHRFAAIGDDRRKRYGFQYHPEVDDTLHGQKMLSNFVLDICGCSADWTVGAVRDDILAGIRDVVGDRRVLLLVSGGVDSSVTAKLLARALGPDQLEFVHIDNGLMRKDESRRVVGELSALGLGSNLRLVDASEDFLGALAGIVAPETKRRIIGDTFVAVSNHEAEKLNLDPDNFVLGQGTIYPDRIETGGTKHAEVIKTHHNRVPIIEQMIEDGRVVEPLADLYKVEVRELGRELGLDEATLERHPFPGPGLGIRVLCSDAAAVDDLSESTAALESTLADSGLVGHVLPIRSVGVKADLRSYEHATLLQPVDGGFPQDYLTDEGFEQLLALAARIYKSVPGINRCALYLGESRIETISPVAATLTRERLDLLREIDQFVMDGLERHGQMKTVWQCPTVLAPLSIDDHGRELAVIRPVLSARGMTARPALLPTPLCREIAAYAAGYESVSGVALDISTKPPSTIEWE